jgi:GT2 family glycosyltransferase
MKIWICIPVFNRVEFTLKCLSTLKDQDNKNFTVVICDHGSTDGTSERIKQDFNDVIVINAESNLWWTGAINRCVKFVLQHAEAGDYLLTLNNDTELPPDYLDKFAALTHKYPNKILTSVIHDINSKDLVSIGSRQNWLTAKAYPVTFEHDHLPEDNDVIEVTHATGRGTLFPLTVFRQLGLYDEQHLPHYGADCDFSHKARRNGFAIYVCKNCKVFSHTQANGMTIIRDRFTLKSLTNYFFCIRSPANLKARWWFAWNNCPKTLLPTYLIIDLTRVSWSYFRYFIVKSQ